MNTSMNTTTSSSYEAEYTTFLEYKGAMLLWRVAMPSLLVVGTLGNIMSIVVLTRKSMRQSTISLYLIVLAVTDMLVLYTGLVRQWLNIIIEMDIRHLHPILCKVHIWLVYSTTDFSCWLLVAVTMERFVSVWFPHNVKHMCTTWTAVIIMTGTATLLLAVNSHYLYGMGVTTYQYGNSSYPNPCGPLWNEYAYFEFDVWPWIDLCLFCLFPFLFLITGNVAIIAKVCISNRNRRRNNASVGLSNNQNITIRSSKTSSMTVMLLTTNIVFLMCTSPMSLFLACQDSWFDFDTMTSRGRAGYELTWASVNVIMYTNNAINFLLYCLSGSRFRETLKSVFSRTRRVHPATSFTRNYNSRLDAGGSRAAPESQMPVRKTQINLSVMGQEQLTDQTEA